MTEGIKVFYNDVLKQIGVGINIARAYPKGHPSMQPVVQRLRILLKEIPIEKDAVSLVVIEDVIMIDEDRFSAKQLPIIKSLVNRFNKVGVKSITFSVDLSENDIQEFFNAMVATPADLADYGDIVALIRAKGITGIAVNKLQVGVVSSDQEGPVMGWGQFLETLAVGRTVATDEDRIRELADRVKGFVTVEINVGQIHLEVTRCAGGKAPCYLVGHAGGSIIAPEQVIDVLKENF